MSNTPFMAWDLTQKIGLLKSEKVRAEILVELYERLEQAVRDEAPAYKIDGIEYSIHEWQKKVMPAPVLYDGIRADFDQFAGDSPSVSFDEIVSRIMLN
jgi:hypothetical protein